MAKEGKQAIPDWVCFLAQDGDGTWWGYEAHPNRHDTGWYENELGRCIRLGRTAPRPDWHTRVIPVAAGTSKTLALADIMAGFDAGPDGDPDGTSQ